MHTAQGHGGDLPKARAEGLLIERVGDETVVYDLESKHAHCLAPLAAVVFDASDGETTVEDIRSAAADRLGRPVTADELYSALAQLEDRALLDIPILVRDGLSRRQAIGKVAFAGAAAAFGGSLITSIAAPNALAAGNGAPVGCTCTKNKDCASNHCCGDNGNERCNTGCCADNNGNLCQCTGNTCPSVPTPPATCTACTPTLTC